MARYFNFEKLIFRDKGIAGSGGGGIDFSSALKTIPNIIHICKKYLL